MHKIHLSIYITARVLMTWDDCLIFPSNFFSLIIIIKKSHRCDDNQHTTVTHFSENKRMHLESSKQNYYIISLWAVIKKIFVDWCCFYYYLRGYGKIFGDAYFTIAQWRRARDLTNVVYSHVLGSTPAETPVNSNQYEFQQIDPQARVLNYCIK